MHTTLHPYTVYLYLLAPLAVPAARCACLPARVRVRAIVLPCLPAPVVRAYIVASPAVLLLAVPAANFFEIVFKPSISIPPSSEEVAARLYIAIRADLGAW